MPRFVCHEKSLFEYDFVFMAAMRVSARQSMSLVDVLLHVLEKCSGVGVSNTKSKGESYRGHVVIINGTRDCRVLSRFNRVQQKGCA